MVEAPAATNFVGIDLSVCNVVVSCSTSEEPSAVTVAVNDVSNRATPAAVGFDGKLRLIGDPADAKMTQLPKQVVTAVPALLGDTATMKANYNRFGCQWNCTDDGQVGPLTFGGRDDLCLKPASCLAALLKKLVSFAVGGAAFEFQPGQEGAVQPFEVAASVPDFWSDAELSNVRAAADILGWKPERVHVLPYSAALATGYAQRWGQKLGEGETRRVVVFVDIGYSQSTVSVAAFSPKEGVDTPELNIEQLACSSAPSLGVHSFCAALARHIDDSQQAKGKEAIGTASKRGARLMVALQKAVKELSMLPDTTVALECFYSDESDLKVDLSRAFFEDVAQKSLQELVDLAKKALSDAGISEEAVHSVELVGGGMRIPCVQVLLSQLFPDSEPAEGIADSNGASGKTVSKRLRFSLDGASAVATGAAHFAAGRRVLPAKWDFGSQPSALADESALAECRKLEEWMATVDGEEVKRLDKCNELESFIYEVRSWLSGPDRALLKPEATEPLLDETARWFEDAQYDEQTTLAMFEEKFDGLKKHLEEHGSEYYEKKRKEKEEKEKFLDAEAEKERQRRSELGMDADKDDRKMAKSERMKMAVKNKEEGNTVFKAGNLDDAAARYQRALQHLTKFYMLDLSPEEKAEADAVTLSVQLNLAQVFLKLGAQTEKDSGKDKAEVVYRKAKSACDEALKVDAENVKARFRKASALEPLGDLDGACKEVQAALKIEPENADLLKLKKRLDKLQELQTKKAKAMYGKMFG